MLVGLFLLYLAVFMAVLFAIQWLLAFLASAGATGSAQLIIALGGMTAIVILARYNLGGIVIAVAIMVFWSLLLFGAESTTLVPTLTIAAGALYAAAAAIVIEDLGRRT